MSYAHTLLIGAVLIAAAVLFTNRLPPAEAQPSGPWRMQVSPNGNIAWRINSTTGEMHYCRGMTSLTHNSPPSCVSMPHPSRSGVGNGILSVAPAAGRPR